jgi:Ca-activated chloride channel family protein
MFRFANIEMLWWLMTIPVFIVAFVVYTKRKRRQLMRFGDAELMAQLMPDASKGRPIIKFVLVLLALILLIVAAARPQYGQKEKNVKRQGIEVVVALDISNSMLAEDVAPNRLDRAKQMLSKMIDNMVDDKVGLIVFAGEAFTQLPITCDYVSAKMFLSTITPNLIPNFIDLFIEFFKFISKEGSIYRRLITRFIFIAELNINMIQDFCKAHLVFFQRKT